MIFGDRSLLGDNSPLANRPDLFWANSIGELEAVVQNSLLINKASSHPHRKTAYGDLKELLKLALALI